MKQLWQLTIDEYIEIVEIAKEIGVQPGESLEPVLLAYMDLKGRKPLGITELTKEELITASNVKKILDISVDETGKTTFKFIKKGENDNV